jgi:Kef-type K+ transport system membrane component KefB
MTLGFLGHLALAIVVTLAATHGMARLVRPAGQPPVVGEMIAGLLLGPSLLGALPGDPSKAIFTSQVTGVLKELAEIGVVLYLFLVGLELGVSGVSKRRGPLLGISLSSLALPFLLGVLLALHLYGAHDLVAGRIVSRTAFTLFLGTALATTALPVLSRILTDTGLDRSRLGSLAIACAAVMDVLGWILLALAVAVARSSGAAGFLRTVIEGVVFVAVLVVVVRPLLGWAISRQDPSRRPPLGFILLILAIVLGLAALSEAIGLHAFLGAVLFGAVYPRRRNPRSTSSLITTLRPVTVGAILPFYFLLPGLRIDLRHLGGGSLVELLLILAVACFGKLVGAGVAARACGFLWREASVMGTLMNTRGLIELVVLGVGVSAHVLDARLYGLMVVMALLTTMMTGPLLRVLLRPRPARLSCKGEAGVLMEGAGGFLR